MKKVIGVILVIAVLAAMLAGCGGQEGSSEASSGSEGQASGIGRLNLYTWEGMFPQELLKAYTQETGYEINYLNFDYNETMLAKLEAAKGGDYDLVIADDYIIETVIAQNLAQKLDTDQIPSIGNVNPLFQNQFFDPSNEYTIPFGAGVQTIVYNPANVDLEITGYEDLWDTSLEDRVGLIANSRVINGMALKVMGESYNIEDIDIIKQAGDKLLELAPNIRVIKDDNIQDDLISGEIDVAVMYTSQVTAAKLAEPSLKVVYPKEGIGFGVMAGFIPAQAPNAAAAHAFLEFILQPENAKMYFENLGYYSTTKAADELIAEEYRDFLLIPESFQQDDMEMIGNISSEAQAAHDEIWMEFKSATG